MQKCSGIRLAVLDDGSTDATHLVQELFPQLEWKRWDKNRGLIHARNFLMSIPGADYFVSLDDDAWFLKDDEVAIAVEFLECHPRVAAVAFDILSPSQTEAKPRLKPRAAAMFIGCGHVLRLSAAREVGLYESVPGTYGGEEKDLCLRMMDAGYGVVKMPGVHVWHDKTSVARILPDQHQSGICNDLIMAWRRAPLHVLPIALAAKISRHFLMSLRSGLLRPCLAGFALFFLSLPRLWHSRRPVRMETLRTFMRLSGPNA
jgi:GT2 family glycosyltransferase